MLRQLTKTTLSLTLLATSLAAQESFTRKVPSVTMYPAEVTSVTRGRANGVDLRFRVEPGFHINSNKPAAEYLIPTSLSWIRPPTLWWEGLLTRRGRRRALRSLPMRN